LCIVARIESSLALRSRLKEEAGRKIMPLESPQELLVLRLNSGGALRASRHFEHDSKLLAKWADAVEWHIVVSVKTNATVQFRHFKLFR
jgi:hypothetical protein